MDRSIILGTTDLMHVSLHHIIHLGVTFSPVIHISLALFIVSERTSNWIFSPALINLQASNLHRNSVHLANNCCIRYRRLIDPVATRCLKLIYQSQAEFIISAIIGLVPKFAVPVVV